MSKESSARPCRNGRGDGQAHLRPRDHDVDAQVLLDADLAIFGQSKATYTKYAEQIRREYAWVPDADDQEGRRKILTTFLRRPRVLQFLTHSEKPALRNISAEIAALSLP